mgnify:CR=1 FL=1
MIYSITKEGWQGKIVEVVNEKTIKAEGKNGTFELEVEHLKKL